jgi:phosphopantothenoylcysteine synthetase/decarboxylase
MLKKKNGSNLILGVCGSIAAYKVCDLIRNLKANKFEVTCILTEAAQKFITKLTLQTLSGTQVYTDLFSDYFSIPGHISLSERADLIIVIPATADIIAKLATGHSDDLLTCVILSSKSKVLICPAMDTNMWLHPATQRNVKQLKEYGYYFIGPETGKLASGKEGIGRLVSIDKILKKVNELIK